LDFCGGLSVSESIEEIVCGVRNLAVVREDDSTVAGVIADLGTFRH